MAGFGDFVGAVVDVVVGVGNTVVGAVTGDEDRTEEGNEQIQEGLDTGAQVLHDGIDAAEEAVCEHTSEGICSAAETVGTWLHAGVEIGHAILTSGNALLGFVAKVPGCIARLNVDCLRHAWREAWEDIRSAWLDLTDYTICKRDFERGVPSVPRRNSSAFSMAGSVDTGDDFNRSLYTDMGRRYEFAIEGGIVQYRQADPADPDLAPKPLKRSHDNEPQCLLYDRERTGDMQDAPEFDMVVASAGRVFAKAKGKDQFYFLLIDEMFQRRRRRDGRVVVEKGPPSACFQLNPQYGENADAPNELARQLPEGFHDHPAGIRFGLFREVVRANQFDFMVVTIRDLCVWHRIESRPPLLIGGKATDFGMSDVISLLFNRITLRRTLLVFMIAAMNTGRINIRQALALAKQAQLALVRGTREKSKPPNTGEWGGLQTYEHIRYCPRDTGKIFGIKDESRESIKFFRVLDIGVGHVHFHEHYESRYGGEMQPILTTHPWAMGQEANAIIYRFLNGPVHDGDAFIDGTCTYYILVQLMSDEALKNHGQGEEAPNAYGVLIMDEQMYFSQRWRLAHPDDHEGLNFSLFSSLADQGWVYDFKREKFWSPFAGGLINARSRMSVSRQVVLVNGRGPGSAEGSDRLYSINISWATCDHSWRWRTFPGGPQAIRYLSPGDVSQGVETIAVDSEAAETVYPQTHRLREDMTIVVRGTRRWGGSTVIGRWYQRYLPADNQHVPAREQLVESAIPESGYAHAWEFVPEGIFLKMDRYHFFGVYDQVDSRSQYYRIRLMGGLDEEAVRGLPENTRWLCDENLHVKTWRMAWPEHPDANGDLDVAKLLNLNGFVPQEEEIKTLIDEGEESVTLNVVNRGALGWIATHWEKHNDDFISFGPLPRRVRLIADISQSNDPVEGPVDQRRELLVEITQHQKMWSIPVVQEAGVSIVQGRRGTVPTATLYFESSLQLADLTENIWRVKVGALDDNGQPLMLLDVIRESGFETTNLPHRYVCQIPLDVVGESQLLTYCTEEGRSRFGTSIWFEDIVGHVATAERTHFRLNREWD